MNQKIRLEFDLDDPTYLPPNLCDTALRTPQAFRGAPLRVEIALFHGHLPGKSLVSDAELAGLVALGLGAKDRANLTDPYLIAPAGAPLTPGLTLDTWSGGAAWHGAFTFGGDATNTAICALQWVLYSTDAAGMSVPWGSPAWTFWNRAWEAGRP